MSDEKYVGAIAAAKNAALTKAALEKKLDKTGGTITGSLKVDGLINAGNSLEVKSDIDAEGHIYSGLALLAPSLGLNNEAEGATVFINCSGDNAARITSLSSDGKSHYSRFAVGTPTGDNDAATKAYVDNHAAGYEVITVTSTKVSDLGYDAAEGATKYSVTFDASFDSILANLAANKSMKFNIALPDGTGSMPISFNTGYFSALNNGMFEFTGTIAGAPIVLSIGGLGSATVYLYADYLPDPNPDGSDDGKSLVVDGNKWAIKKAAIDDAMSDTSTNPVQNKVIKQYVDEKGVNYFDTYVEKPTKEKLTAYANYYKCECKATHTYAEIAAALAKDMVPRVLLVEVIGSAGAKRIVCPLNEYYNGAEGSYDFDAPNIAGMYGFGTGIVSISEDGAAYTCSAGELPPATDKDNGKCLVVDGGRYRCGTPAAATQSTPGYMSAADKVKLDGIEEGANKTTVDAALDAASENPVQNKAVKAALDSKLSTQGGEISGHLSVGLTVSAEGAVSTGRTSTDTGIHFEKAGSDVGRISHGSDPMTGVAPIARLKVASPTEDDDAATKAYVDGRAVRYDAAQTLTDAQKAQARENVGAASAFAPILTSPVMIRKFGETESAGVYLSTIDTGEKHAEIRLEDVNENAPVAIANLRTPTGAGKDDYVATKGYVDSKVASGSGVTVDTAMSGTSTNPVQNKVIKQYVDDKVAAAGSNITVDAALSSTSANPVQNKAVKAAIDAKADKTALDAKADKTALNAKLDKTGGTLTGNLTGKYITGTWLQSTAASDLGRTPGKIAVLDDSGWVYYRTPAELFADLGIADAIKSYVDAAIVAAINSAY